MSAVTPFPAEKEYEKNPDISREEIRKFREWLDTQPHLPGQRITELDLIVTYHCCDNSIEVAKQVLDLHFTLRTLFHGFFKDRCYEPRVDAALQTVLFAQLPPTASVLNYRVFYMRLLQLDPKDFNFTDVSRVFMMTFDLAQLEEGTWPGFVMMIDMDQATLGHIGRLELMTLKKVLHFLQECMLVKLREVHFINAPAFIDKLMMMLRPFLSKKLMDIIYIHPVGTDSINKYIVKDCMPKEDGGSFKSRQILRDELIQRLKANQCYFRDENLRRVAESRRAGGTSRACQEYGMQGSFKKLDLD